ncbi:hypothetical protein [Nevskia sp.]|uniref:hypothetical protein n=1 Tax=Nevskia sp. TaxID=1929292 RepID=UPI0025CD2AB5|nr:hypothetical protein [Nevskia sp.]
MKFTRSEFADGFKLLGLIGLIVGVAVVPGQWMSGAVHSEALVGIVVSGSCVLLATLLALSVKPALEVTAQLLFFGGLFYLALVPFISAQVGWHYWQRLSILLLASAASAFVGWHWLRLLRAGAQPGVQADRP